MVRFRHPARTALCVAAAMVALLVPSCGFQGDLKRVLGVEPVVPDPVPQKAPDLDCDLIFPAPSSGKDSGLSYAE